MAASGSGSAGDRMTGWEKSFARRTERMRPSEIREILKLTQRSEVISLAGGLPAPSLFPAREVAAATSRVMATAGTRALQYGPTQGISELREWVAEHTPGATADAVLVVSGSQQALDLVGKILLDPGDAVAVAAPSYMGALRAFDAYEPRYLTVTSDAEGMLPDALEDVLAQRPKLLYVIPDFDNPSGSRMGLGRRHALLEIAERFGVPVYEDAPYRELRFEGEPLPTLLELAPDRVLHAGTLSKTLAPGLRLAWLIAPPAVLQVVERAKQAADLHTSTFTQLIAHDLLAGGLLEHHVPALRTHYREQRDVLAGALEREFGADLRFERPLGGMFLWAVLPEGADSLALLELAVARGVAFVPGQPFFADGSGADTLRLSYSLPTPDNLVEGAARLADALRAFRPPA